MYKKVLVPLDGSDLGESILPYVAQLARGLDAKITVMHVADVVRDAAGGGSLVHVPDGRKQSVKEYLHNSREVLQKNGVARTDVLATSGVPSVEIVEHGRRDGYDLIAMATHGRSGLGRWVYGSTTDKVLHSTDLPMLLLRPRAGGGTILDKAPMRTAIVPLDGSALAEEALPVAEELAKRLGLKVTLVRIVPMTTLAYSGLEPDAYYGRIEEEMEKAADDYLKEKSDALRQKHVQVAYHSARGYPAGQLVDFAEQACNGVIIMTTHGRTGVGRWVLGSVADRVLRSACLPVLLLRSAGFEGE